MQVIGAEFLLSLIESQQRGERKHFTAKMVFNAQGAIFFPATGEHRDHTGPGIRYADSYKGNALAAMLTPGAIEVRYHAAFKDGEVARILQSLAALPELAFLAEWRATYQGRPLQ
jgi:hypothetical protein